MQLFGLSDHLIAEHDPDLAIAGRSQHGFEPGLLRSVRIDPGDVSLEPAHEEEQSKDGEGPDGQDHEKDRLVAGHIAQFVRA